MKDVADMGRDRALCKAQGERGINRGAMPPNPRLSFSAEVALQPALALEEEAGAER